MTMTVNAHIVIMISQPSLLLQTRDLFGFDSIGGFRVRCDDTNDGTGHELEDVSDMNDL